MIEDGSPFMRSGGGKDKSSSGSKGGRGGGKDPVDQLGDDMWSFMNLQKKDFIKDSIPDQQLSLQELTIPIQIKSKVTLLLISLSPELNTPHCQRLKWHPIPCSPLLL